MENNKKILVQSLTISTQIYKDYSMENGKPFMTQKRIRKDKMNLEKFSKRFPPSQFSQVEKKKFCDVKTSANI